MEKEKKVTKTTKSAPKASKTAPKSVKAKKVVAEKTAPKAEVKVEPVKKPVVETKAEVVEVNQPTNCKPSKKTTFNQDLNLIIGFFSLLTILSFCFIFEDASVESIGWEIFLNAGAYSGVFKGIMILYVVSIFIDCILSIKIDTECEIFNIIEKALYMFTLIMNFVTISILISLISHIGIGLILFLIISIISAILKLVRIFVK